MIKNFIDESYLAEQPAGQVKLLSGKILSANESVNAKRRIDLFSHGVLYDDFFVRNAHFFYEHRDEILSDSRMFLSPVKVYNNLMGMGHEPFRNIVLGAYIEWWLNCPSATVSDADGNRSLLFFVAGSSFSGNNECLAVDIRGAVHAVSVRPFMPVWRPLASLNARYQPCSGYEAFTLHEVAEKLSKQ
jgi:hypothetical protein